MHEAFYVASTGRPGPVVVDIPKDVQFQMAEYTGPQKIKHKTYSPQIKADQPAIYEAVEMLSRGEEAAILHWRRGDQLRPRGV